MNRTDFRLALIALSISLFLSGCDSSSPALEQNNEVLAQYAAPRSGPLVSAHRGGAAYAPENTLNAYRNAARLGVDDFETDTSLSADGVLVLIHDDTLDRTTNCSGPVSTKTFSEIQQCDAGYWFSPGQSVTTPDESRAHPLRGTGITIPTPESLFAYARSLGDFGPSVTIEIKNIPYENGYQPACINAATKLVKMIQESGIAERIVVQSFDPTCIATVKVLDAKVRTLYLTVAGAYAALAYTVAGNHDIASPPFDTPDFDLGFVGVAHAVGKQVIPYTADRDADIRKLLEEGVDGLITNYPACMLAALGRRVPQRTLAAEAGDDQDFKVCKP